MFCPSGKHENRAGRKFCVHCGAGLELVCPSCGARSEPGERFCGECGSEVQVSGAGSRVSISSNTDQLVTPHQVYLTENSAKLVSGFFRLRDIGPIEIKGVSAPVWVQELEGVSALHTPIEGLTIAQ